ncbi:type IV toxin-antitoxin system AbiEi family antitoxin domain-containing protein [Nocardioides sp. NPDC000445]|uniref:type IV toxin-antitoxin system AbiEi family antitoxin domain-containing protein n=1 Tax=Nocardioides sp. NPDC000445 TaxID=3154257 RepID=UPI003329895A
MGAVADLEWYSTLLQLQAGLVSRAQLTESGWTKSDIRSAVRHNELRRVHPRVYVNHTGPLTFEQRSWAAILYAGRSAICGPTLAAPGTQRESDPIHVAIDQQRRVDPQPGIVLHRMVDLADHMFPDVLPRLRFEDNLLLMAGEANDEIDVIGVLGRGIGRRGVSVGEVRMALRRFPRLRRRAWIADLLEDLAMGTDSVLEHGYLTRVERAHGLPIGTRQALRRTGVGNQYRDIDYPVYGLVVELDGRLGHDSWNDQGRDADRDLDDLALVDRVTARLRWQQVYGTPCRTATRIARILAKGGWPGVPFPCGDLCQLGT